MMVVTYFISSAKVYNTILQYCISYYFNNTLWFTLDKRTQFFADMILLIIIIII